MDEVHGRCLQIHSCDDGASSFPLAANLIQLPDGDLYLRAVFDQCVLSFFWSTDDRTYHEVGVDLDASILSDDHGDHWGFTGTFIGLACQDLTGRQLPAEFDYLEVQ
jgi:xylan 1,4-beta-xylosidase